MLPLLTRVPFFFFPTQVVRLFDVFREPESTLILWPGKESALGAAYAALKSIDLEVIHMVWDKGEQSGHKLGKFVKYVSEDILVGVSKVRT